MCNPQAFAFVSMKRWRNMPEQERPEGGESKIHILYRHSSHRLPNVIRVCVYATGYSMKDSRL